MIKHFIWKFKYRKFVKKWLSIDDRYKHTLYYQDLFKLVKSIDKDKLYQYIKPSSYITTYYSYIDDFIKACQKAQLEIISNNVKIRYRDEEKRNLTLEDFFSTSDGYSSNLVSSYTAVLLQLESLIKAIDKNDNVLKIYHFNQLSECFITGSSIIETMMKDYSQ